MCFALLISLSWVACSQESPPDPDFARAVTPYSGNNGKNNGSSAVESGHLEPPSTSDLPITSAGFRAEGETIYNLLCASCHQPIPISNRRGVDAGKILNDYTRNFPTHRDVKWPVDEEAFMIEAALAP